jgi:DHA1 family inner membrane transport protein
MPIGLIALALGGFGIGLTEFGIIGLLPQVAASFRVTGPVAGYLVSGYALSVAVGAIVLTAALGRVNRKKALLALMTLFVAGNLISALAPDFWVLLTGRIVAALCHGAFFGIGAVVAADMVPPARRASAIALMFGGLTVANVLGVPLGTLLGEHTGWRSTFWALTIIGVIVLAAIRLLVPLAAAPDEASLRDELGALREPQVWISAAVTALAYGGMFGGFTYIAFTLTRVTGFTAATVPWLLLIFGAGTVAGNFLGGKLADRKLDASLIMITALLATVLAAFSLTAHSKALAVVWLLMTGGVGLAAAPGLQLRVMRHAQDAPTLASSVNIAAFNIGNALGAWLCGLPLAAGLGFSSPLWVSAGMVSAGFAVLAGGTARLRRGQGSASATANRDAATPAR